VREAPTLPLADRSAEGCTITAPRTTTTRGNSKLTIRVSNYWPLAKLSLVGKCDVHIRELRMTARGVLILSTNGKWWVSPPSPAKLDKEGHALRDESGKVSYANAFTFDSKEVRRDAFSAAVINALLEVYPDAFDHAEGGP
jgi:hypothetical protein